MGLSGKEKKILKNNIILILPPLCRFVPEEKSLQFLKESKSIPELLSKIIQELKIKEESGWDGSDLEEEQLRILGFLSDLYLKKYKSKYKIIDKPSEILEWFSEWVQSLFNKNELKIIDE